MFRPQSNICDSGQLLELLFKTALGIELKFITYNLGDNRLASVAISKLFCNRFKWPKLKMLKISCNFKFIKFCHNRVRHVSRPLSTI